MSRGADDGGPLWLGAVLVGPLILYCSCTASHGDVTGTGHLTSNGGRERPRQPKIGKMEVREEAKSFGGDWYDGLFDIPTGVHQSNQ